MIEVEVRLYGAFRDCSSDPSLHLELAEGADLEQLREALELRLAALQAERGTQLGDLLQRSVFADQSDILPADARLYSSQVLSLIPPVCGG